MRDMRTGFLLRRKQFLESQLVSGPTVLLLVSGLERAKVPLPCKYRINLAKVFSWVFNQWSMICYFYGHGHGPNEYISNTITGYIYLAVIEGNLFWESEEWQVPSNILMTTAPCCAENQTSSTWSTASQWWWRWSSGAWPVSVWSTGSTASPVPPQHSNSTVVHLVRAAAVKAKLSESRKDHLSLTFTEQF